VGSFVTANGKKENNKRQTSKSKPKIGGEYGYFINSIRLFVLPFPAQP
jgi:hypothetical protein